jgi:putative chitinase
MTAAELQSVLRAVYSCSAELAAAHAAPMSLALKIADVNTALRLAHWLAQIGHESGRLRWMREIWGPTPQQLRYEPTTTLSARLGNTRAGDGRRYMGRGLIQTTGRGNYRTLTARTRQRLGNEAPDFGAQPALLESLEWAAYSAADYWATRGLNAFADANDLAGLTRKVNGGTNGLADRQALLARANMVLRG